MGKRIGEKNYFLYFLLLVVFIILFFSSFQYGLFQNKGNLLFELANSPSLDFKKDSYPITSNVVLNSVNRPKLKVFILEDVNTCIVGDPCITNDCISIKSVGTNQIVRSFKKEGSGGAIGYKPNELTDAQRNSAYCLHLVFSQSEIDAAKNKISSFQNMVLEYSNNRIALDVEYVEISDGSEIKMSPYANGFWVGPWDIVQLTQSRFTRDTDFVITLSPLTDPTKQAYFESALCDGAMGSIYNSGIPYAWVQIGCHPLALVHAFLHELAEAINKINPPPNFKSYESNNYEYYGQRLSCSTQFNGLSYFPDADVAPLDPDFDSCRGNFGDNWINGYCASLVRQGFDGEECNRRWDRHLYGDHFPMNYIIIGNQCRNGKQDYGETGIDNGGSCSIYPQQQVLPQCPNTGSENPRIIGCRSSSYPNYPPENTNRVDVKTGYSCSNSLVCYECKVGYIRNVNTDLCDPIVIVTIPNVSLPCPNIGETPTAIGCRVAGGPWTTNAEIKSQYSCPSSIYSCYQCRAGYIRDTRIDICVSSGEVRAPIIDTDNDGVPDLIDRCPNQTSQIVGRYGCPIPIYNNFSSELTTNLSDVDLTSLRNFRIGIKNIGQIDFGNSEIKLIENISNIIRPVDLNKIISLMPRKVIVRSELFTELNKPATVTIFNITNITNIIIKKDGALCTECRIVSYVNSVVTFSVPHFSEYSVDEGSFCGDGFCSSQESCSSCQTDCGSCQSAGTSGTGGGGSGGGGSSGGGSRRTFIEVQNLSNKSGQNKGVEEQPIEPEDKEAQTNKTELVELGPSSNNKLQLSIIRTTKSFLRKDIIVYIAVGFVLFILFLISIKKFGKKANKYGELEKYVNVMRSKGKTDVELRNKLMAAGWDKDMIERILKRR